MVVGGIVAGLEVIIIIGYTNAKQNENKKKNVKLI